MAEALQIIPCFPTIHVACIRNELLSNQAFMVGALSEVWWQKGTIGDKSSNQILIYEMF